jgi:hypothetical protein
LRFAQPDHNDRDSDMLNYIEVFDVIEVDPTTKRAVWTGLTGTRTALQRDGFVIDPEATAYCPKDWLDDALDSLQGQEPNIVSRRSVLSMRAGGSIDSVLPLRGYLLSVGGALLCLLLAADWVLPAPLPTRIAESETALPPIRIHSDVKRPDPVVIDTHQAPPVLADSEDPAASPQLHSSEGLDAAQEPEAPAPVDDGDRHRVASMPPQLRDGLAQAHAGATPEQKRTTAHARSGKRRRIAMHPESDTTPGWCDTPNRGACSFALMPFRAN